MKQTGILIAGALTLMVAAPAMARTNVSVSVSLGQAPPPPVVVVQHAPTTVWLPETHVAVVHDDDFGNDMFQCGSSWYVYRDGWWYRGRTWRGPYAYVETRYVPQSIMVVPARHWHHYPYAVGAPGHRREEVAVADHRGDDDERGHGKDKDKHDNGRHRGWHNDDDR